MTVQREDHDTLRIVGHLDTRDIAVRLQRQIDGARLMTLDVIREHLHLRILFAWNRILIGIESGIVTILFLFRRQSLEQLHGILRHIGLVVANPDDLL